MKSLLYAYRVLLTGIHLLQTGAVEAHLPTLAEGFDMAFLLELIALKRKEKITAPDLDWAFHSQHLDLLEQRMTEAFEESTLPEARDQESVNALLVRLRLGAA